jgi:hypothetical protein
VSKWPAPKANSLAPGYIPNNAATVYRLEEDRQAVRAAIDHALLWLEWKALAKASNKPDADVVGMNKRMADLQHRMDAALVVVKRAKNTRGKRANPV